MRRGGYTAHRSPRRSQIELADKLEHVLLRPDVTPSEVDDACASAVESGLAAVTVWPADVPRAAAATGGSRVTVVAAVTGPDRTAAADPTLDEARRAIQAGARHLAVALDPRAILGEDAAELARQLQALCRIAHAEGVHVRAVLQAPLALAAQTAAPQQAPLAPAVAGGGGLAWMRVGAPEASPSATELAEAGRLAVEAGADLLQTGFGVWGRATLEQVRAVRWALPTRHAAIGVIAGGAKDASAARHLLERAGADRVAVLDPAAVLRGVAAA